MKKIYTSVLILLLLLTQPKISPGGACDEYYNTTLEAQLHQDKNISEGSILFFGDSIFQSMYLSDAKHKIVNFGITCDTIPRLTKRILRYQSAKTASKIFINIGINDILFYMPVGSKKDYYTYTYKQLIEKLPTTTPVFFICILPVNEYQGDYLKGRKEDISAANNILKKLCEKAENRYYVNVFGLTDSTGNLYMKYSKDGLHLSPAGYDILIRQIKKIMDP